MSEHFQTMSALPQEYAREGTQFLKRCQKPSMKEFMGIAQATAVGFLIMGFVGFFVKLIHIPINNVLGTSCPVTVQSNPSFLFVVVALSSQMEMW